ncbi:hypothetical protein ABZZ74_26050 [Streptomyces sp. NPDC006476]|uniref:hypothetical protein n=1 Tax=Streptomyces sp. NPDC006476 TaxID=3157175 RepID=UPI0033B10ADA
MFQTSSLPLRLLRAVGPIGVLALVALGAAPAVADEPSPGLVLGAIAPVDGARPGSTLQLPTSFTNTGPKALDKVWLSYTLTRGLSHTGLAGLPSNCWYLEIPEEDEEPNKTDAVCEFDQTVKPGVVFAPEKQLSIDVRDSALYDRAEVAVVSSGFPYPGDNFSHPVPGTAPAIKLVEQPDATPAPPGSAKHADGDFVWVPVTSENTADFQVTGARVEGRVGDTVPVTVKYTNAGPGWVWRPGHGQAVHVLVRMPAGTTVTKSDPYCSRKGPGSYGCSTEVFWVKEGYERNYTFQVRIDKAVPGARGSVELTGGSRPFDPNAKNDKADIPTDVTGGGASPNGGASATPSTGPSPASGGGLANTGSGPALPLAGAAAAAVVLGAGALLAARRRASRR